MIDAFLFVVTVAVIWVWASPRHFGEWLAEVRRAFQGRCL